MRGGARRCGAAAPPSLRQQGDGLRLTSAQHKTEQATVVRPSLVSVNLDFLCSDFLFGFLGESQLKNTVFKACADGIFVNA